MGEEQGFLSNWSRPMRLGIGLAAVVVLVAAALLTWWLQRTPKAVLFSDMAEADVALIASELDKLKQPYDISQDGRGLLVDQAAVHRTRMALMAKQLPLHGVVGFELFNQADFGVSDFVQKVNYQRALQGELTRTILAIEQVQEARVHLALPEQTLFRKDGQKAKASVTLTLKPGQSLQFAQVAGVQRLVAASVSEIKADDVTVLDQHGVVLSRSVGEEGGVAASQLDARQALEAHLTRKAARLLEQMFANGEALVAVDVILNHDHSRVTTEEVLPAKGLTSDQHPAGVLSRERHTSKASTEPQANAAAAQVVTQESDYQNGRRTEHMVSQGGQIARLSVAVVVRRHLGEVDMVRLRQLVATAVGVNVARGDVVVVHSVADLTTGQAPTPLPAASGVLHGSKAEGTASMAPQGRPHPDSSVTASLTWLALGVLSVVALAVLVIRRVRAPARMALSAVERAALLRSVQQWLHTDSVTR